MRLVRHSCYPCIAILAIKKAKKAKDELDKKTFTVGTPAAGIAAPTLRFLRAEKLKQVRATGLTKLLPSLCNRKSKNGQRSIR